VLHWLIALILISAIAVAWQFDDAKGLAKFQLFQLHKSLGITVLVLSLARLGWRLINPAPAPLASLKPWEKVLSKAVHVGFYVIMLGMPLTGWLVVSASPKNIPTLLYGIIDLPYLPFVHGLWLCDGYGCDHTRKWRRRDLSVRRDTRELANDDLRQSGTFSEVGIV
jgi:cytochrome b561